MAQDIVDALRSAYGDLDSPRLGFVLARAARQPFAGLVADLTEHAGFALEETSDFNHDVCFAYAATKDGQLWSLQLSLVGPFALLARTSHDTWTALLDTTTPDLTRNELALTSAIGQAGLRLFSADELAEPSPLNLGFLDLDDVWLYQALFSRTDELPWERPARPTER